MQPYPCIVIEMSSQIKYKPTTTQNNCDNTTEYTLNVCQNTQQSTLIDGSSVTCDGTSDTRIAIYISTGSTWTTGKGDPFLPPASIEMQTVGFNSLQLWLLMGHLRQNSLSTVLVKLMILLLLPLVRWHHQSLAL